MVGRRARKSMSGAANDSTTKFPISGKVPLEWLMHRLASPSPGHAQSVGVFVTPGRPTTRGFGLVDARSRWLCATCLDNVTPNTGNPCVATVQLGGVSRPSNVRASARPMSQWVCSLLGYFIVPSGCGVPSLIVSSAPRSNLSLVWVVDRWVWMLLLVRNGHVSGEMVVCVDRLRASCIELSSRTPLQCRPLVVVVPKGRARCPECVDRHDSTTSVHRCSIVLLDAENLVSVGSRPRYSLFDGICYSDNRSNSRANTCNKPRLLEGMHLLDKRLTRALPVALMIHDNSTDRTAIVPATHHSNFCPINFRWGGSAGPPHGEHRSARPYCRRCAPGLNWSGRSSGAVTLKKLECLYTLAWDNITGF
ncbi:hypothetical protein V6N13_008510 [Hibiscus sabdariffa]